MAAKEGARLVGMRAEHPEADRVQRFLVDLGLELKVTPGPKPRLLGDIGSTGGAVYTVDNLSTLAVPVVADITSGQNESNVCFRLSERLLNIMGDLVPAHIAAQLDLACAVIDRHLASTLLAVYLYGSALDGGLQRSSDIDLLVIVAVRPNEAVRRALLNDLLAVSVPPGQSDVVRALEVTVVVQSDVVPWHYPARRELQFGEWLRPHIEAGMFEPATVDADVAILLTKARQRSVALVGPGASQLLAPVPKGDFFRALADTLELWHEPADWAGDERNVVLTLARIWYSAATGKIVPKHVAAYWAMVRLPAVLRPVLLGGKHAYLGHGEEYFISQADELPAFVSFVKAAASELLNTMETP